MRAAVDVGAGFMAKDFEPGFYKITEPTEAEDEDNRGTRANDEITQY